MEKKKKLLPWACQVEAVIDSGWPVRHASRYPRGGGGENYIEVAYGNAE